MSELMTTTYSMWRLFRNCRMACKWRYIDELVPLERDPNLAFGSVIHDCLEVWHGERDLAKVLDHIDRTYPNRAQDDHQQADWHLARAMMSAYAEHYPAEDFEVIALEKTFEGPIVNPATGAMLSQFHPGRKGGRDRPSRRAVFPARTQDRLADRRRLSGAAVDRFPDHSLRLVPGADPRHHDQRHHLQRPGQGPAAPGER